MYLTDFSKISFGDCFTPSYLVNVLAGQTYEFYVETKTHETMLLYIEFSQEDKTKDITFEVKKYEISTNSFKQIFIEERVEDTFKFFILVGGYSLYQIVFNNYYSWFISKDINYKISLLRLKDTQYETSNTNAEQEEENKNKEKKIEQKEEKVEKVLGKNGKKEEKKIPKDSIDKFSCSFAGRKICFNKKEINKKIKNFKDKKDIIIIPVIFYLNHLRIVSITNDGKKEEVKFIEKTEEDENFIPKYSFDFCIVNYLQKTLKIKHTQAKDKKIIISIFSQNRDLSALYKEVEDQIKALNVSSINNSLNDNETQTYLEKIGFYPSEIIEKYKVEYELYDLCEQSLIYHLYLLYGKDTPPKKPILFMQFDKYVVNAAVYNEGAILSKLNEKEEKELNLEANYLSNIKSDDTNKLLDFIKNTNKTFKGIDLVLSYVDKAEDNKKELFTLFETIKKNCEEKINPTINVSIYEQNEITNNVFNYMNLFYHN